MSKTSKQEVSFSSDQLVQKMNTKQHIHGAREGSIKMRVKDNNEGESFSNNFEGRNENGAVKESNSKLDCDSDHESVYSCASESDRSSTAHSRQATSTTNSASSSSGRSSADQESQVANEAEQLSSHHDPEDASNKLHPTLNLTPESDSAMALVDSIRRKFLASLEEEGKKDSTIQELYDWSDLEELRRPLPATASERDQSLAFRLISRFVNFSGSHTDKDLDELQGNLEEFLQFRQRYKIPATRADHFCKEFFQISGIFQFGHDKNNLPVVYIRARVHRRWSQKLDESFRHYVAWNINEVTKSYRSAQVAKAIGTHGIEKDGSFGVCFDCLNVSYACVDIEFLKFLVKLFINYYPTYCRYALCIDLPWLFRSVWRLVRSWLPEDAQNSVQLITAKQLTDFISEDQIPNSIKYNDLPASEKPSELRHRMPDFFDSLRSISDLADGFNMNSSERKQFKSHLEKVLKDYKQLGAI